MATDMETNLAKKLPACFSNLPIELRLMCYEFARPEARVVKLSYSKHHKLNHWPYRLFSGALIPNLLHVCRESRELALKWYKLSFGPSDRFYSHKRGQNIGNRMYFDWSQDWLYVQCNSCRGSGCDSSESSLCGVCMLMRVQKSLIKRVIFESSGSQNVLWRPLIWFPNAENVKFVHWTDGLLFRHEAKLSDIIEFNSSYHWQQGKTMCECFNTQAFQTINDELGKSLRGVKTFSEVALRHSNTLSDVLQDAKIQWLKGRAGGGLGNKS